MAEKRMNDTDPVVGFNPVTHDKPAPGGQTDHTSPGIGQTITSFIQKATGSAPIIKALGGK